MPSLRRSISSPSVRSSPYPTSLSSGNPSSSRVRASGQQPRRSSGSDTNERRVLADIEWWKVYDGQCDLEAQDQDQDQVQTQDTVDVSVGGAVTLSAGGGSLEPLQASPLSLHSFSLDLTQSTPVNEFAALSIAPHSPSRRRYGRDSSFSSLESTPELTTAPLEVIHLGLSSPTSDSESFHVEAVLEASLTRAGGRVVHPFFGSRSYSFGGFSNQESTELQFADMGGDSFSLDQNLFH
ncbi:hypothetical protein HYDPIDRAFT_179165 [Hydnomerulius pinastri MD-312]|nr:hypothetical protein HYDPIDRAFT_179165 [Hydnomerulius pinastri MD-312]